MDRLIVTVERVPAELRRPMRRSAKIDPENRLLWRMNRKRLEGETHPRRGAGRSRQPESRRWAGGPVKIPIEPEVYDLIFTEGERDGLVAGDPGPAGTEPAQHLSLQQAQRAPADARRLRPAGCHHFVPGAPHQHAFAAGALAVQLRLHAGAIRRHSRQRLVRRVPSGPDAIARSIRRGGSRLARPPSPAENRLARAVLAKGGGTCRISAWRFSTGTSSSMFPERFRDHIPPRRHPARRAGAGGARIRLARARVAARLAGAGGRSRQPAGGEAAPLSRPRQSR